MDKLSLSRGTAFLLAANLLVCSCARRHVDKGALDQQLIAAAGNRDTKEIHRLLLNGAKIVPEDQSGDTALSEAARESDVAVVSALLDGNVDPKYLNQALIWAAMNEPLVITVKSEKPIPYGGPKFELIDDQYSHVARLLLDKGADVEARDEEGSTPLLRAAGHGETGVVKLLLERGAQVEDIDNYGLTPLNAAACDCPDIDMPDTLDAMQLLLERGASIESKDHDGNTPLIHAAEWGRTENVEFLLQKGANLENENKHGNTALSMAASGGGYSTFETVKLLLDHKSEVETKDSEGRTPLMLAVLGDATDQIKIVKLLLKRRANVWTKDKHGDTALSLAEKDHKPEIYVGTHANLRKLLRSAMAAPH